MGSELLIATRMIFAEIGKLASVPECVPACEKGVPRIAVSSGALNHEASGGCSSKIDNQVRRATSPRSSINRL
jgi:hypothetical protein